MDTTRGSLLLRIGNNRDTDAWTEFYSIYHPMLMRFARAAGLREEAAEEIAQICLARIAEKIKHFEYDPSRGRFRSWLNTMVRNEIGHWRRRPKAAQVGDEPLEVADERVTLPDEKLDNIFMEEHLRHCLRAVQKEVEEQTFEAFRLYVMQECPVEQVCDKLGVTANQVYKAKQRITEKLEERMRELVPEEA